MLAGLLVILSLDIVTAFGSLGHTVSGLIADMLISAKTTKYVNLLVSANLSQVATW